MDGIRGDHQVRWFHIPVNQFALVNVLKTDRSLPQAFADPAHRQNSLTLEPLQQIPSGNELGHEKITAARVTGIERRNDVRIFERGDEPNFPAKTGRLPPVVGNSRRHDFDGHQLPRPRATGFVDDSHFSAAKDVEQDVFAQSKIGMSGAQLVDLPRR